jgi:7,8-dihydropterin-6-yl-methyl-4-(beta-D-ribofuranosyl)aminobenzene 5'-phosphate synthase
MLDVHPPHTPTHTWKDFSIHIATICMPHTNPSRFRESSSRLLSRTIATCLLLAVSSYASRSAAQQTIADKKMGDLKITILSTMLISTPGGTGEWWFSALVQADGHQVLVDTGAAPDTVLKNAKALGVDLSGVRDVILTHNHDDHTSGLLTLRRELSKRNPEAMSRVYVGPGIFWSRPTKSGEDNAMIAVGRAYEATGGKFVEVPGWQELFPGAWLTGPIKRKYPERNWDELGMVMTPAGLVEDTIPEDLSLVLNTTRGLVVITGCGHAGIINILSQAADKFDSLACVFGERVLGQQGCFAPFVVGVHGVVHNPEILIIGAGAVEDGPLHPVEEDISIRAVLLLALKFCKGIACVAEVFRIECGPPSAIPGGGIQLSLPGGEDGQTGLECGDKLAIGGILLHEDT